MKSSKPQSSRSSASKEQSAKSEELRVNKTRNTLRPLPYTIGSTKIPLFGILVLSFIGFLDSVYLTVKHISNEIPPCSVTHGCETVLTSQFATVGPIPIAAFGVGYFVTIMVLTILYLQKKKSMLLNILFILATLAFLAGLGLVAIQAFILHAFCAYCLLAELLITLLFLLTAAIFRRRTKD